MAQGVRLDGGHQGVMLMVLAIMDVGEPHLEVELPLIAALEPHQQVTMCRASPRR
jgi:hypothetical protein